MRWGGGLETFWYFKLKESRWGGSGKNEVRELKFDAPALFLGLKAGGLQSEGVRVQPPPAPPEIRALILALLLLI